VGDEGSQPLLESAGRVGFGEESPESSEEPGKVCSANSFERPRALGSSLDDLHEQGEKEEEEEHAGSEERREEGQPSKNV
jgi:hypothetical protein